MNTTDTPTHHPVNIALIGFKCCGKSTLGPALAALTGRTFHDTDTVLEARFAAHTGQRLCCREIYAQLGEVGFRQQEHAALCALLQETGAVIATGGGVVSHAPNLPLLRQRTCTVFLDTAWERLHERLHAVSSPLFATTDARALYQQRRTMYEAAAHCRLEIANDADPALLAGLVLQKIQECEHVA